MAGTVPVRWGIDVGAVLLSYAGSERVITWVPAAGVFPLAAGRDRKRLMLNEPGSLYYPRCRPGGAQHQEDVPGGPERPTRDRSTGSTSSTATPCSSRNSAVGSSLGQIQTILQGRLMRLAFQMKW